MKLLLHILAYILLFFNGAGALFGGWNLMIHPDGSSLQLSLDWLKHTPFPDYLIPGIILFIANGLFGVFVFIAILLKLKNYCWLIMAQGAILAGWIVIQMALIRTIDFLHVLFGSIGIALFIVGWMILQYNRQSANPTS
jgi:hypothetical protein